MHGITRFFCALLIVAASAFSQAGDDPHAINGYDSNPQGYYFMPGNRAVYAYCAYIYNPNNPSQKVYIANVNVQISILAWNGSGWHTHEATGGTQRPYAEILTPNPTKTGNDGCVQFGFRFPWFSGWYTIEATSTYGRTGVNEYTRYWAGNRLSPTFLQPYPDNLTNNWPQSLHTDTHHGTQGAASRWLLPSVVNQVTYASENYALNTAVATTRADLLDITRGSLPDGGRADNEGPGMTPDGEAVYPVWIPWSVRSGETHSQGSEVDVVNPLWYFDATHTTLAIQAMQANNCPLGNFDTYTIPVRGQSLTLFWGGKDIMHFVCKPNGLSKY